ncbi:MAG: hypothetical protein U0Z26_05610 [Anaerolineales bacterium]
MLNLPIAMLKLFLLLTLLFQDPTVTLTSPSSGGTLRGQVEVFGTMDVPNFSSAELAFSFSSSTNDASRPAESWFTIQTFPQPVKDSAIAIWDTTTLTDGDYDLHLRVYLQDGTTQDALLTNLKVRNDAPEPTATPLEENFPTPANQIAPTANFLPSPTPTLVFNPPTALPSNPAALHADAIYNTLGRGALATLVLFVFISLLMRLRKN